MSVAKELENAQGSTQTVDFTQGENNMSGPIQPDTDQKPDPNNETLAHPVVPSGNLITSSAKDVNELTN